jgi:hypothetical protein
MTRPGGRASKSGLGAAPEIRYFQLQMLLDNEAGCVTEWSQAGDKVTHPAD